MAQVSQEFSVSDEVKDFYRAKRREHIDAVNDFARKIGYYFPEHDADKLRDPIASMVGPCVWARHHNLARTPEMSERCRAGIVLHKTSNSHHPEFWKNIADMPEIDIIEMCCDWRAANAAQQNTYGEFKNVLEFYELYALPEYKFTQRQQKIIEKTLGELS